MKNNHLIFMKRAFLLAKRGEGMVSPNPCVGACVVKNGVIIGEGYHKFYGGPHAEVEALKNLSNTDLENSTLYVTLEPCNHYGKTPPCTELILQKRIKNVVVGVLDKNPLVSGKGVKRLQENGVNVITGIMEEELNEFYRPFFKYVIEKKPFVTLKVAQSIDGKNGVSGSRYLVSQKTLNYVHRLRYSSDAIMVGVNTVNTDDPELNIRFFKKKKTLIKVVLDYFGRIRTDAKIFQCNEPVIIYTKKGEFPDIKNYKHVDVVKVEGKEGMLDLDLVFKDLANRGIANLLVEGGGILSFNMLKNRLVDRLILLIAPFIVGGKANFAFNGEAFESLEKSINLANFVVKKVDRDLILIKEFFKDETLS